MRWKFDTIEKPWRYPLEAGGGGLWYPVSVDGDGRLYAGNSNPTPWGGTPERPNGGAFPGPALYTDSLLVLDARTGRLLWHDQVTPHDVRDYDFQATPILATVDGDELVFGAGKARPRDRLGPRDAAAALDERAVGLHRNDVGPLPRRRVTRLPGPARRRRDADGLRRRPALRPRRRPLRLGQRDRAPGAARASTRRAGRGRLVALDAATGRALWERRLPVAGLRLRDGRERRRLHLDLRRDASTRSPTDDGRESLARAHARGRQRLPGGRRATCVLFGAGVPRPGGGSTPSSSRSACLSGAR